MRCLSLPHTACYPTVRCLSLPHTACYATVRSLGLPHIRHFHDDDDDDEEDDDDDDDDEDDDDDDDDDEDDDDDDETNVEADVEFEIGDNVGNESTVSFAFFPVTPIKMKMSTAGNSQMPATRKPPKQKPH